MQGVADLVLVFPDHLELVDYKTDRKKDAARLLADYAPQLELYALALNKRFVADLVLVFPDHLELVDYKTDRKKDAARLLADYAPQLELYALALNKRFAPRQVTYKGIYSFALGQLIQS